MSERVSAKPERICRFCGVRENATETFALCKQHEFVGVPLPTESTEPQPQIPCEHGKLPIEPCDPCGRESLDIDGDELVQLRGTWPTHCIQRAFVDGAKWWQFHQQGSTMFPSERDEVEAEAVRRFGDPAQAPLPQAIESERK